MHSKTLVITSLLLFIIYTCAQDVTYSGDTTTGVDVTYTDVSITTLLSTVSYTTIPTTVTTQCTLAQKLFNAGGTSIPRADDSYKYICFPVDVPIGNEKVDCVFIYVNGIVSTNPTYGYEGEVLDNADKYTFAPFWTDIDIRLFGSVTYKELEKYPASRTVSQADVSLLEETNTFIKEKGNLDTFDAVYALIVTWTDVVPHRANTTEKTATFQFVLATNGTFTYATYIYDICNLSWDFTFKVAMGYASGESVYNNLLSLDDTIISDSLISGNNGAGTWVFLASTDSPVNYKLECLKWHWDNINVKLINPNGALQCPCTESKAQYSLDLVYSGTSNCYQQVMPFIDQGKTCCYDSSSGTLIRGNVEKNIYTSELWPTEDVLPYQYCCSESNYCNLFFENRPADDCSLWKESSAAFMFGDPHFRTMDGVDYTFNGYGEFELLNVFNSKDNSKVMTMQCRTRNISTGQATVFEAFAFKTPETHVQVMTSLNAKAVVISENHTELTQFQSDNNFQWRKNGVFIRKNTSNENVYWITFSSGFTASITFANSILQFGLSVTLNQSTVYTNGLLGTFNGNKSDDFELPDKSYLSIDSDEETIYKNFGLRWMTNDSIFQYENGRTASSYQHPEYVPVFWNQNLTTNTTVNEFCDNRRTCIYDYLQTNNKAIAEDTRAVNDEIVAYELLKSYPNPVINGSKNVYLSINQTVKLEFNIIYTDLNITLEVIKNTSAVITMSNDTVIVTLTAIDANISAAFQIKSTIGHETAIFELKIIVCPQCMNGTCDPKDLFDKPFNSSKYIPCSCDDGVTGDDCSIDNRCAPFNCTDTSPLTKCVCKCPEGYRYIDDKCVETDECSISTPCEQTCTNTKGSFSCSCKAGFVRNGTNCTDVNECDRQHGCEHMCNNTEGSFTCYCYPGYELNADGKTCNISKNLNCSSTCADYHGCRNATTCFCRSGYSMNSTGCYDINECEKYLNVCGNGTCVNNKPGYECTCEDGYSYDQYENICVECPNNKWGPNCNGTCNPGACVSCDKKTGCVCEKGKQGENCTDDINECDTGGNCDLNTTFCINAIGSYTCPCKPGYKKNSDIKCSDIDECITGESKCSQDADCANIEGSYKCTCKSGFIGDGFTCEDINECNLTTTHNCTQYCNNTKGSYACTCKTGYHISDDRITCVLDDNYKCNPGYHNCSEYATCSSTKESYTCTCNDGFEGNGFTCTDIDECLRKEYRNCSIHGRCMNFIGSYNCTCNTGWTGNGFNCTAIAVSEYFDEQLIYIIVGVVLGLLVWLVLMIFCVWCCCFGGYRRHRSRHETLTSTLDYDPYNVHQGFGSLSSSFTGRGRGRYYFGKFLGTKYLRNWAEFSPDAGDDPIPGTSADSINEQSNIRDSRWKRVLERVNKTEVFHIDRPEISTRSYYT